MDGRVASAKSVAIEPKPTSGARTGFRSELAHGDMVFFIRGDMRSGCVAERRGLR